MRKILVMLMLIFAVGLFAQIPAGTKSITVVSGAVGDFLDDDDNLLDDEIVYEAGVEAGYFVINGLEIDLLLGIVGSTAEGAEVNFTVGPKVLYHFPITQMLGVYGGAGYEYNSVGDGISSIPAEVGGELFLTQNNAIRVGLGFTYYITEGLGMELGVKLGAVHYIP
ncbi:MAG: outer membrane beta-barrel protein [candidate division WOR-3 bacterium]